MLPAAAMLAGATVPWRGGLVCMIVLVASTTSVTRRGSGQHSQLTALTISGRVPMPSDTGQFNSNRKKTKPNVTT